MKPNSKMDQLFQELEAKDEFSGVVLMTKGDAEIYSGAFGYASRSWKIRNNLDIRFDTASLTKMFTTVAVLQLIDQKILTFETSAIQYLGLEGTTISEEVNVYHLLTHTSGIGDDCEEEDGEVYEDMWKDKPNYSVRDTEDFLPQFIYKAPNFAPGQGCRYCNCSFILLGLMIEKASGMPYRDYVRAHIFEKAGLLDSDFLAMDRVHERVAEGCDPIRDEAGQVLGWKKNIYSYPPIGSPDSGAYVTAGDLDRFMRAVQGGELLSQGLTKELLSPHVTYRQRDGWVMKYGYCLWFYVDQDGEIVCYQKEGVNAGVSALIRHFPEQDINVVILSNMEEGVWAPIWKIHEWIVKGEFDSRSAAPLIQDDQFFTQFV
jgi:CubicO group peptidase (beta-lactamase class C family)